MKKLHPIRDLGAFVLGLGLIFTGSALTLTSCDNGSLNNNPPTNQTQDKTTEFKNKLAEFNQEVINPNGLGTKEKRVAVNKLYTELLGYNVSDDLKTDLNNSMLDFVISNYEVGYATLCGKEYASINIEHVISSESGSSNTVNTTIAIGPENTKGLYIITKRENHVVSREVGEGLLDKILDLSIILSNCKNKNVIFTYDDKSDFFLFNTKDDKDSSRVSISFDEYSLSGANVNTLHSPGDKADIYYVTTKDLTKSDYNKFIQDYKSYSSENTEENSR